MFSRTQVASIAHILLAGLPPPCLLRLERAGRVHHPRAPNAHSRDDGQPGQPSLPLVDQLLVVGERLVGWLGPPLSLLLLPALLKLMQDDAALPVDEGHQESSSNCVRREALYVWKEESGQVLSVETRKLRDGDCDPVSHRFNQARKVGNQRGLDPAVATRCTFNATRCFYKIFRFPTQFVVMLKKSHWATHDVVKNIRPKVVGVCIRVISKCKLLNFY